MIVNMSEYISTRGEDAGSTYEDVLLAGQASDGGIFIPNELPQYDTKRLEELSEVREYPDFFVEVRSDFVGDSISRDQQTLLAHQAYTEEKFPGVAGGNYVPVRHIGGQLYIQALSEGPTAAFKDMALQAVGQDMEYVLDRLDQNLRILGATSGDTGSAAEASLKGLSRVSLFMLSPKEGMSEFQRAQMAALSGENIHNIAVNSKFDPLQKMVTSLKKEEGFEDLGAVNSINWARVASQIPYYFSGYLQVIRSRDELKIGDEVDFVVPSGNMGNALAAYEAKRMGLPIRKIIVATNENDVLDKLIQSDVYAPPVGEAETTSSPSMDIKRANNFERIVADLLRSEQTGEHDPERVREYMRILQDEGSVSFARVGRPDISLKDAGFESGSSTHADRLRVIGQVFNQTEGTDIIDPHTADAVGVALRKAKLDIPTICMETAKAVKFEPTITQALGFAPERTDIRFADMEHHLDNPDAFYDLIGAMDGLKRYISANS